MSTTVTYKGSTLTTVNNQTRTLKTAGKYMEGDVILTDVSESGTIGNVWQDENGYIHLDDEGTSSISIGPLSVTQNGTYTAPTGTAYSPVTVNVSGGGGGASNFIQGTFTGTTAGTAMDINIPYTGNGYPICVVIYPTEGPDNSQTGNFYNLVSYRAVATAYLIKAQTDTRPTYDGIETPYVNNDLYIYRYKNSTTSASTYSNSTFITGTHYNSTDSVGAAIMIKSDTKMSVFIKSDNYGFAPNIEYTYNVIYSS